MDKLFVLGVVYICCVSTVFGLTTLKANYNMGGVTGNVTFSQNSVGQDVTIVLDLTGMAVGSYTLQLHEFRVNFDMADICSIESIGKTIGSAAATSGKGTMTANGMDLWGTKSIEGRSFLITDDNGQFRVCATIESDGDYITAFANLPANIGGTIVFRQQDNSPSADAFMYTDFYFIGDTKISTPLKWQINSGIVKMDIDASTDINNRCGSTIKEMYNPNGADNAGCNNQNHDNCKIGDLSAKHGDITIATTGNTRSFYGDLKLPLSGANSIIGKTIAFLNGTEYFACANIVQYTRKKAVALFTNDGVTGSVTFTQTSPLDSVSIDVDLNALQATGGGYHVHMWPVPQQVDASQSVCSAAAVSGHFNPFAVNTSNNYPSAASTTPDKYEVGDLSGKFGTLASMNAYTDTVVDPNLQLFGTNSIVGRSLVIHKNMANNPRWICTTIQPSEEIPMTTAYARFTYPVIGYMVLRQPKDMWYSETQIYVELNYGNSNTATTNHKWHIHEAPMGDDLVAESSKRCKSVGGHYNPYSVYLQGDYSTQCSPSNHFRCEVGDLSGKHGKLSIRTALGTKQKLFFTDMQLPLSGPQSIMGKSITIHEANDGNGRLSCADVREKVTRTAAVTSWSSAKGQGSPTGDITFTENCDSVLACTTSVNVQLSGLNSNVAGYHVHEYPTDASAAQSQVCQSSDVGGHLNPFAVAYPGPPAGTLDQYEIGDLSGKFNPLTGSTYSTTVLDTNLPMEGPWSIVGRSITIHRNDATSTRWACGNIMETTKGSTLLQAMAEFTGDVKGTITLSQYKHENGDMSNTFIVVNLRYNNDSITTGHNWHVHENPFTTDCASCGGHYNPYMVDMDDTVYSEECSLENPLRCEMGDQAKKLGRYDIGDGKRFFTDVNLNLEGKFAAAKRSIVIHGSNGGKERIACANLIPYGPMMKTFELSFLSVAYTRSDIETKVAASIGTQTANVLVNDKTVGIECTTVTVYFLGDDKSALRGQFNDVVTSNSHALLGKYAPVSQCKTNNAEFMKISFGTVLLCFLFSKLFSS